MSVYPSYNFIISWRTKRREIDRFKKNKKRSRPILPG